MNKILQKVSALLFAAVCLAPQLSKAQNSGYIVTGPYTSKGVIIYKKWAKAPAEISFKAVNESDYKTYKAGDISEFGITVGTQLEVYRSFDVAIDRSAVNTGQLDDKAEPRLDEAKKVFALLLVDGKAQLYNYTDDIKSHFLFKKEGGSAFELINKDYIDQSNNQALNNAQYKKQLLDNTSDCMDIKAEVVKAVTYSASSLSKFVNKYNACFSNSINQTYVKDEVIVAFNVVAGAAFGKLSQSATGGSASASSKTKVQPAFGLGLTIAPSRSRFNYVIEALYTQTKNSIYRVDVAPNQTIQSQYDYDFQMVKINAALKILLGGKDIKPFLLIGVSNNIAIKKSGTLNESRSFYTTTQVTSEKSTNFPAYQFGGFGGAGVNYNQWGLQARYEILKSFDAFRTQSVAPSTAYLLLTYTF